MITYCLIKYIAEEVTDYEELAMTLFFVILSLIFDILLILIQPILYIVVKNWEKENE